MKNGPLFIKKKDGAIQNVLRINIEGRTGTMSLLIPSIVWCWKWYQRLVLVETLGEFPLKMDLLVG